MVLSSSIAAFIPTLLYIAIIYWVDRYEKEPLWLLSAAFLWGAIPAIIVALIFNGIFGVPFYVLLDEVAADAAIASFVAPFVEETAKGLALIGILYFWRSHIDSVLDGIIYGAMIGLGFAMIENIFYFLDAPADEFNFLVVMRAYVFGLNHSFFTAITGIGMAVSRLSRNKSVKVSAPIFGWIGAVFVHFVHNASASLSATLGAIACIPLFVNAWGGVLLLGVIIVWALVQEKNWIKKYLAHEMSQDTITTKQYKTASSKVERLSASFQHLFSGNISQFFKTRRFYHQCSRLAYACHHEELYKDEEGEELVQKLRDWVKSNPI
ncbi:MAG: RsiW-degrading membrane proteinase PrsW (M82 family) [Cellvibrionaceae bacterium]|jgi:RsiW-degrading membrane proteinase PrsW (M82 family)